MKKYIIIKADTNDGDYVTEKSEISDEDIIKIKEILLKVERNKIRLPGGSTGIHKSISWETGDMGDLEDQHEELSEEEKEFLDDFCPYGENGIHTIESIDILEVVNEISLL